MRDLSEISSFLEKLSFKKKLIGGVDEADILRKIQDLEEIYERTLDKHICYYEAIIADRDKTIGRLEDEKTS